MSDRRSSLWRLGDAWSEELSRAVPKIDRQRGCERLLAAQRAQKAPRRPVALRSLVAAAALLATVIATLAFLYWPVAEPFRVAGQPGVEGAQIATASDPVPIQFNQGSEIILEESSQARIESSTTRDVRVVLERGALFANVNKGAHSTWTVEAGPFSVVVTGTQFEVRWDPLKQLFSVDVTKGSVKVTGPLIRREQVTPVGIRCAVNLKTQSLSVGPIPPIATPAPPADSNIEDDSTAKRVEVDALPEDEISETGDTEDGRGSAQTQPEREVSRVTSGRNRRTESAPTEPNWSALERSGKYREAVAQAERIGLESIYAQGSASELLQLARAARFAGRTDVGTKALTRCRSRFPGTSQAAMAAFLLGRAASPSDAARWFSTYLKEQPRGTLAREAAGRLVESYARSGQMSQARTSARTYLGQYPDGPHADYARRLLAR